MTTGSNARLGVPGNTLSGSAFPATLRSPGLFAKQPAIGLTMLVAGILVFGLLAGQIGTNDRLIQADLSIAKALRVEALSIPWSLVEYILFGFFVGRELIVVIGAILAIYFLYQRHWREFAMMVTGLGGGMLIWYFFSRYFDRPGPVTQLEIIPAIGPSFPSGSTLAALLCYGLLAYLLVPAIHTRFWKWMVLILSILVIAFVGLSSLIIGSHYATDVIAGYALGLAWAGVIYTLAERFIGDETTLPQGKIKKAPPAPGLRTPGLFGKRPIVALIVILSGSLTFAALGYSLLNPGHLVQLDNSLHQVLLAKARNAPPAVNEIMLFGFFAGKQVILLTVTILSIYFFHKRYWPELGMLLMSSAAGSVIWNLAISYFARPRPHQQAGLAVTTIPSFPSGHSMSTVICFGFLAYLLVPRMPTLFWKWTVSIAAILIILFNGFSRMFHGGHYLTDVIGGYALGLAWASLVYLIIENISLKRKV